MGQLKQFATYLKEQHLHDLVREQLDLLKKIELPMMKYFAHLTEEQLFQMSVISAGDFLTSLEEGKGMEKVLEGLKQWEEDKIPGLPKTAILPTDLVLAYYLQKISLIKFIPDYTADVKVAMDLVHELEDHIMTAQNLAVQLSFKIKEEADRQLIMNEELEKKVEERTVLLENANKELEAFTYSVSHDLRAPLRSINGFSQVLIEDHSDKLDDDALEILGIIKQNAKKMGQLVDDLLSFSKLGKTDIQKLKVDMNEVVKAVLKDSDKSANKKAEIILHPLPPADADFSLLTQAWGNLISNALKYSSPKQKPTIEIGCENNNGENVYFVRDNGVGFDMKYYHKLFGVFQRLHKQNEFEGTGVGLAIVQRIVNKHQGKVWADSKLGEGTTFYFSLNDQQ